MICDGLSEITSKAISIAGGFLGGTSMMLYMRPINMMDAARRIVISVLSAVMLTNIVSKEIFGDVSSELAMGTAFIVGFLAWSILGAVAKFFEGRQNQDILQMVKSVNSVTKEE